jgi:hypothetical protein
MLSNCLYQIAGINAIYGVTVRITIYLRLFSSNTYITASYLDRLTITGLEVTPILWSQHDPSLHVRIALM